MQNSVSVIIFMDYEFHNLKDIIASLENQTKKPSNIYLINNNVKEMDLSSYDCGKIQLSKKMDLFTGFAIGMNSQDEYICIINDNLILDKNTFENCIIGDKRYGGLFGINGYRVTERENIAQYHVKYSPVDFLSGMWFMKKSHLSTILRMEDCFNELYPSYIFQKYLKLNSYVVSNTKNSYTNHHVTKELISKYLDLGFEFISDKENNLKDYDKCLEYVFDRILKRNHFALIRYGDGEYFITNDKNYKSCWEDNWSYTSGGILSQHLKDTYNLPHPNVFYGAHSPKCSVELYYRDCFDRIPIKENITFACIFVNNNFKRFKTFVENNDFNVILISSQINSNRKIGNLKVIDNYIISPNLVTNWDNEYDIHLQNIINMAKKHNNEIFFIASGPLGKIFVHQMYKVNNNNTYIDIGSPLDLFNKNVYSRAYFYDKNDGTHKCYF